MPVTIDPAVLASLEQRTLYLAKLWVVERNDGVSLYLTDHDTQLRYKREPFDYTPINSFNPTSISRTQGFGDNGFEASGIMGDSFNATDFIDGVYDGAKIIERVVDWRTPQHGAIQENEFWFREPEFDGDIWSVECEGLARLLRQQSGRIWSRICVHELGRDFTGAVNPLKGCRLDENTGVSKLATDFTDFAVTVTSVGTNVRKVFSFTDINGRNNSEYREGRLEWTAGANRGQVGWVKFHNSTTDTITLYTKTLRDIAIGDICSVEFGCNKTTSPCENVFNNIVNFGGPSLLMPGPDGMMIAPLAKQPEFT